MSSSRSIASVRPVSEISVHVSLAGISPILPITSAQRIPRVAPGPNKNSPDAKSLF
jgi:hypothetical protein